MTEPVTDHKVYDILPDGTASAVTFSENMPVAPAGAIRWVHLRNSAQTVKWLVDNLPPPAAHAMTIEQSRPRAVPYEGGTILILRGVNLNPGADREDMVGIRAWLEPNLIVTVYRRPLMAVADLQNDVARGAGPHTPGDFARALSYKLTERMEPVITDLSDKADALEDLAVSSDGNPVRSDIADLRREAILLRRYIAPQKDALNRLSSDVTNVISESNRLDLREAADRVTRMVEELDAVRERCAVLNDQLLDQRAEEMNRNMFILSVIAAVFLPLGFLTGLLGVNVGGIPGADNNYAFLVLCIIMVLVGIGILAIFRKLKWL